VTAVSEVSDSTQEGKPPLFLAVCAKNLPAVEELLDNGANANDKVQYNEITAPYLVDVITRAPPACACQYLNQHTGFLDVQENWTALHEAVSTEQWPKMVKVLIERGKADPSSEAKVI
jgi:ankyrin repeat protein